MAHVKKSTRSACGNLFDHYGRNAEEEKYKYLYRANKSIDPNLTCLNYNLAPNRDMTQNEIMQKRLSEVKCLKRKDVNVMCSWVVTVPKEVPAELHKEFFEHTYNFLKTRYDRDEKNVVSAYVHMDETTPHLHYAFVPVVEDKKSGKEKVSAKECITRLDLQTFHNDLQAHLSDFFVRDREFTCNILNGATSGGNKTIEELKTESLKQVNEQMEQEMNHLSIIVQEMYHEQSELESDIERQKVDCKGIENDLETNIKRLRFVKKHLENNTCEVNELVKEKEKLKETVSILKKIIKDQEKQAYPGKKSDEINFYVNAMKEKYAKEKRVELLERFVESPEIKNIFTKFCEQIKPQRKTEKKYDFER